MEVQLLTYYFQTGDRTVFTTIYSTYFPKVVGYLETKVSLDLAEDIAQDVFLRLMTRELDTEVKNDLRYLIQSARNLLTNHFEKLHGEETVPVESMANSLIDDAEGPEEEVMHREEYELRLLKLRDAIADFPDYVQEIILFKFDDRLSSAQIGRRVNRPAETVRTILRRWTKRIDNDILALAI